MAAPVWQPGTLYLPGDLVQPITMPAPTTTAISNAGFELGSFADWTAVGSVALAGGGYGGSSACAEFSGSAGVARIEHDPVAVVPGVRIRAQCMYAQGSADAGQNSGAVFLTWLTAGDVEISEDVGNLVTSSSGGGWKSSVVTAYAPAGAAKVVIGCLSNRSNGATSKADAFGWDYAASTLPAGLIYQAVQAAAGHSAADEPDWPPTLGVQVVDHEVTWEAVATSRVTWTASPLFTSGATEPDWPTEPGERVVDNTIAWECVTRRVTDAHCPNTTVVAILAAKVLAVDGDIVRHSAAANPLDWTTARNAGFLATGLQQANASDFAVLAPYRNNLAAFNAHCFQHWQMDPDPELCAQIDQLDGVGSLWPRAAVAVSNELFYLTAVGVRSIGIAVGAQNLAAGDVGEPIDDLVREALRVAEANGSDVLATYYPGMGQYWLAFADVPPPALAITGDLPDGVLGDPVSYTYTASGGVQPRTFSLHAGALPDGLTLDASTGAVTGTRGAVGEATWTVRVTDADGSTADVADTSDTVDGTLVSATTLQTFGISGAVIAWSPDSTYLAVTGFTSPHVHVYKRTGDSFAALTLPTLGMSSRGQGMDWSPDGNELAVAPEVTIAPFLLRRSGDSFTQEVLADLVPGSQERGLAYHPDGDRLVLTYGTDLARWLVAGGVYSDGADVADLPANTQPHQASGFSPDGALLATAYSAAPWLDVREATGSFPALAVQPTVPAAVSGQPRFSVGSDFLGWATDASPFYALYQRDLDTDAFTALGSLPANTGTSTSFDWHPAGANFAVGSTTGDLRIFKRNGTTVTVALNVPTITNVSALRFSPNGDYLAVAHIGGFSVLKLT